MQRGDGGHSDGGSCAEPELELECRGPRACGRTGALRATQQGPTEVARTLRAGSRCKDEGSAAAVALAALSLRSIECVGYE